MVRRNIVVIGASSGGVDALQRLVRDFHPGLPAAIFVVIHTSAGGPSLLASLLTRAGPLPAHAASDLTVFEPGNIYVGVPDWHMLVEEKHVRLWGGPKENRVRPAIDPLFRSAALAHRERVVGVLLTGSLDDGTAGLLAVKAWGGVAIVQDPDEAFSPSMPRSALKNVPVDHRLPLAAIAEAIALRVEEPAAPESEAACEGASGEWRVRQDRAGRGPEVHADAPSAFACPACGGVLWEVNEQSGWFRFRCRVGHAYAPQSLVREQEQHIEDALWYSVRGLEELAELKGRLAQRRDLTLDTGAMRAEAHSAREFALRLRNYLTDETDDGRRPSRP